MARSFNGTSDFINCGNSQFLNIITDFTCAGWGYTLTTGFGGTQIMFGHDDNALGRNFFFGVSGAVGGAISFGTDAVAGMTGATTIPNNKWYHIAVVYRASANTGTVYFNGSFDAGPTGLGAAASCTANFCLGQRTYAGNNNFWGGNIADPGYWACALSPQEIYALAHGARPGQVRAGSLHGWWPLDGYNAPALDKSVYKNNGVLNGTAFVTGPPLISPAPIFVRSNVMQTAAVVASGIVFRRSLSSVGTRVGSRQAVM
jgi:hypothetical protein